MEKVTFKGNDYPAWQASGFAARFSFPFAEEVCNGNGLDIGCNRPEWAFPGAVMVDPLIDPRFDAMNLPEWKFETGDKEPKLMKQWEYIFSSHCLEHLERWTDVLDYWYTRLTSGGVLFLYLPSHSQKYWRSWHNRKHIHNFTPEIIGNYFKDQPEMWRDVLVSNVDLNDSFITIAYKV